MVEPIFILLVEDDRDDADLFEEALKENSVRYKLKLFLQGDKIVPWLESCEALPDIVVLDLNVPKLHGIEILKLIRADGRLKNLPVVILSTSSSGADKARCLELGANNFIKKPVTTEGFKEAISVILETLGK